MVIDHSVLSEKSVTLNSTTDKEIPDPKPLPKPTGWQILLRPVPIREQTKGGIFLPESVRDDYQYLSNVARVLAIGPNAFENVEQTFEVGDYVVYGRHSGKKFQYKGVLLTLLDDERVLMVVDDPTSMDPHGDLANSEQ